jgi:hypothetical protein
MNLRNITIKLDTSQVQEILRIDMDEDAGEALMFVKEILAKQVKASLQPH